MPLEFTIKNVGFGELFNPRNVEVVLRNNSTGDLLTAALSVDPRFWTGGETDSLTTQLAIPDNLPDGTYSIGLWMPDIEATLRNDVRFAIRFANEGVWEAATGFNILTNALLISSGASGPRYENVTQFVEVPDPSSFVLVGDYNEDGDVDMADYGIWRKTFGSSVEQFAGADGNGDGMVDAADYSVWRKTFASGAGSSSQSVVPEPATVVPIMGLLGAASMRRSSSCCRTRGDYFSSGRFRLRLTCPKQYR
jgi:hypothetical protein